MSTGMKYSVPVVLLFSIFFMACSQKEKIMTKKEMQVMTDSIVATKTADIHKEAAEDLDRRKSIEVKAKADSIVEAWQTKQPKTTPKDTIK